MRLRSISVRNVRSYTSATLPIGEGTTLLTGDVGSGKTSLLYAVEMALFGFAEVEPGYLVRHRAREAEVTLTLGEADQVFEFRRKFRRRTVRGKESFEIEENSFAADGHRTKYSATELRQRGIDLLGFPDNPNPHAHSDVWRWAVYIPQERMREVLLQKPAERLGTVRKALGLEQYQTAAENAQELAAELRRIAEQHETAAEQLRPWTDELPRWSAIRVTRARELTDLEDEELGRREASARAEQERQDAETAVTLRLSQAAELARLEAEAQERSREAGESRGRAAAARADAERLRRQATASAPDPTLAEGLATEVRRLRGRLMELRQQITATENAATTVARSEATLDALRAALARWEDAGRSAENEARRTGSALTQSLAESPTEEPKAPTPRGLQEIDADRHRLDGESRAAQAEAARLDHVAGDLEGLVSAGVCPRCHQTVHSDEFGPHLEEARREFAAAKARAERLDETRRKLESERRGREMYERNHERYLEAERARATLREQLERFRAERATTDVRAGESRAEIERLEGELAVVRPVLVGRARDLEEFARTESEAARSEDAAREAQRRAEEARALLGRAELFESQATHHAEVAAHSEDKARDLSEIALRHRAEWGGAPDPAPALARARESAELARSEVERVLTRAAATRAALEEADRRIVDAERSVRLRGERLAEAQNARALSGWLAREFREGLLDLEHRRLAQAQTEFNRAFARYFQMLVEDPNLVARCDLAFSPSVDIDGESTPAEALSGGERTALALAFRLAMGRVVRGAGRLRLETLILDEPTDGFSPEQVLRMGELLDELRIPQVLIVSHETALAGIADRVVRVTKSGGESKITLGDPGARASVAGTESLAREDASALSPSAEPRRGRPRARPADAGTLPAPTAGSPRPGDFR